MPIAQPNYLSTDSNGETSASFPGGLDMLESDTSTPEGARSIRWFDVAAQVIAYIYTYTHAPGSHQLNIQLGNNLNTGESRITLRADNSLYNTRYLMSPRPAQLGWTNADSYHIFSTGGPGGADHQRTLLNGFGESAFVQAAAPPNAPPTMHNGRLGAVLVSGLGGSSYAVSTPYERQVGGQWAVAGTAVGVCRCTLVGVSANYVFPWAQVLDNAAYGTGVMVIATTPNVVIDVYTGNLGLLNRSFYLMCLMV